MKAQLRSVTGENKGEVELPEQFREEVRPDLIKRAVLAQRSHRIQQRGTDPEAGKKYSSKLSRRRRNYKTAYGIGISRVSRKILSHRGSRFNWQGATNPNTVGGREAHPPKSSKIWARKINRKERNKAIRSAMSASVIKALVKERGHIIQDYPLVLEDGVEELKKTKEVIDLLNKLGLKDELERASLKTENTGKARRRGRRFKKRKGPLIVVSKKCGLIASASNIPGVDVITADALNPELLAPGADYGRLTLYTKGAVDKIEKTGLFMEHKKEIPKATPKKARVKQTK